MKESFKILMLLFCGSIISQNIKSIQLRPLQENAYAAIVPLGSVLELSFDDLDADSKEFQYKVEHMTPDWQSSGLSVGQYIDGFEQNSILNQQNSFNTFQNYTHYWVQIPNRNTIITKTGNYLLSILNDDDEVLFTRRFVLYENKTIVGVNVLRSRNAITSNSEQTIEFSINHPSLQINNPGQEIEVVLMKNNNWNETISGVKPTFFKNQQLIYTYSNKTNFLGGNEYLNIDTKFIRTASLNVYRIIQKDIFNLYIYPYTYLPNRNYNYSPDINGQFVIRTLEANNPRTEADYARMHFTLEATAPFKNKEVYVYGAFNDFSIEQETKMKYDPVQKLYYTDFLLKQGFYNYTFATVDSQGNINPNEVHGSFFETENEYTVLVYYKPFGSLYYQAIGVGKGFFNQNN